MLTHPLFFLPLHSTPYALHFPSIVESSAISRQYPANIPPTLPFPVPCLSRYHSVTTPRGYADDRLMLPCILLCKCLAGSFLCLSRWLVAFGATLNNYFAILHTSVILLS